MRYWVIRVAVLAVFAVVAAFFGPRAMAVLSARFGGNGGPVVDLDRVGLRTAPVWLRENAGLVRSVLEELAPLVRRRVRRDAAVEDADLLAALRGLSWVDAARLEPVHPDRLALALALRRPVLEVVPVGAAVGTVVPVLVDVDGICMHRAAGALPVDLPKCRLAEGPIPGSMPVYELGKPHPDPRVHAAAKVAVEWRDQMRAAVPEAPLLLEVDASNLGYRLLADQRLSEVCVVLRRADGGSSVLAYGHPPDQPLPRVALADKARVLRAILARFPGLNGVDKGDLRFVNLWENWLRPRPHRTAGSGAIRPGATRPGN